MNQLLIHPDRGDARNYQPSTARRALHSCWMKVAATGLLLVSMLVALPARAVLPGGKVLSLNGTSAVQIPSLTSLAGSELTIQYWFRGSSIQSAVRQQGSGWIVAGWNGQHILNNDGGLSGVSAGAGVTDGKWHHVMFTWKQNTVDGFASYLDGQLVEKRNSSNAPIPNENATVWLGCFNGVAEFTTGELDGVAIWQRALTSGEVATNWSKALTGSEPGLVAYWDFDAGNYNDKTAHAHHGTPSGNTALVDLQIPEVVGGMAITEFMAQNTGSLRDSDGDSSDWIEIHNGTAATVNLTGWSLTDTTNNLRKWLFPSTNLAADAYLVVFASGKTPSLRGGELHANFSLSSGGEYLGLVDPNTNIVSEYAPMFAPQVADVSYGVVYVAPPKNFLTNGSPLRWLVPTNGNLGTNWILSGYNDSLWRAGTNGVGYDQAPQEAVNYTNLIRTSVGASMFNSNASILVRLPFVVANPAELINWRLRMQYDDGFKVWLNGEEVVELNTPAALAWNSLATAARTASEGVMPEEFNLGAFQNLIVAGTNTLAVQGLNAASNSTRFVVLPELLAQSVTNYASSLRYFAQPTPGAATQTAGVAVLGPILTELAHTPVVPTDVQNLVVTVRVRPAFGAVTNVTLLYRVMYSNEVATAMFDDGAHGDGVAGDGVFGATIPASASSTGQMLRYRVTALDAGGRSSREPLFIDPLGSPEYRGTIVSDLSLTTPLPVFHWFVQNPTAAETATGTRCSLFYDGEFYDNIYVRIRGNTAILWPKKSYKFELNEGEHLRLRAGQSRVSEFNLNTTYTDKSYNRAVLASEFTAAAGLPVEEIFHVQLRQNNSFYSVALCVEEVDADFLARWGRNKLGSLYKASGQVLGTYEKKTRVWENNSDLTAFLAGPGNLTGAALENFVFDNYDVPGWISYMAALAIRQDIDASDKNHYLYRDTLGSGEWSIFPWDLDLSFGPDALNTDTIVYNLQDTNTPACASHPFIGTRPYQLQANKYNRALEALVNTPRTRQMLLRRLRTLSDEYLAINYFQNRIDALIPYLAADVTADHTRWGTSAHFGGGSYTLQQANDRIKNEYLAPRVGYLTGSGIAGVGAANPNSQPAVTNIQIQSLDVNPVTGNQLQEYICLTNPNSFAVDLTGWSMRGDVEFEFKPATVMTANSVMYLSPDPAAFRARTTGPRGGMGLFVQGSYRGNLSARGGSLQLLNRSGALVQLFTHPGAPSLAQEFLRITELMYHPAPLAGSTNDAEDFEFVELRNTSSTQTLDLTGVRFIDGIQFNFTSSGVTNLAPNARVLVVKSLLAFVARYGNGLPVAGQYSGSLDNAGERIRLVDARGEEILDFEYGDHWYRSTDGLGFSLVIVDDLAPWFSWGDKASWRPSGTRNGSPGVADTSVSIAPVLINEVLAHTDLPAVDSIELFNPTPTNVNIGGWYLTDDLAVPQKYRINSGTSIPANGYTVINANQFGSAFLLSEYGESVWLLSGDTATNLTGYVTGQDFSESPNGVSFGRHLDHLGHEHFVLQSSPTLGSSNGLPRVGPVVISEIMYHPPDLPGGVDDLLHEFIELQNITGVGVPLYCTFTNEPAYGANALTNTWRLGNSVDFRFPLNTTLAANSRLLVVGFDPTTNASQLATFRTLYALPTNVPLFGPWQGKLDNSAATIELKYPDKPDLTTGLVVPYVMMDKVNYLDVLPWPPSADGLGNSLQRRSLTAFGNDPVNWMARARPDSDGDGMPDWWELLNGLQPGVSDGALDPDEDGMTNLQEYFAGTNPHDSQSRLKVETIAVSGGVTLTFLAVSNCSYTVQLTTALGAVPWRQLTNIPARATNHTEVVADVRTSTNIFYRILTPQQL